MRAVRQLAKGGCRQAMRGTHRLGAQGFQLPEGVQPLFHLTEDRVLAVQPGRAPEGDEELRAVGVGTRVCHGQRTLLGVLEREVLVVKLATVNAAAPRAVPGCDVPTLGHEIGNDAVEGAALVAELGALLTRAKQSVGGGRAVRHGRRTPAP